MDVSESERVCDGGRVAGVGEGVSVGWVCERARVGGLVREGELKG